MYLQKATTLIIAMERLPKYCLFLEKIKKHPQYTNGNNATSFSSSNKNSKHRNVATKELKSTKQEKTLVKTLRFSVAIS